MNAFRVLLFTALGTMLACLTCGIWTGDDRWLMTAAMPAGIFAIGLVVAPFFWEGRK